MWAEARIELIFSLESAKIRGESNGRKKGSKSWCKEWCWQKEGKKSRRWLIPCGGKLGAVSPETPFPSSRFFFFFFWQITGKLTPLIYLASSIRHRRLSYVHLYPFDFNRLHQLKLWSQVSKWDNLTPIGTGIELQAMAVSGAISPQVKAEVTCHSSLTVHHHHERRRVSPPSIPVTLPTSSGQTRTSLNTVSVCSTKMFQC